MKNCSKLARKYLIYISGPTYGDHNKKAFFDAETMLKNLGYDVFNPRSSDHIDALRADMLRRNLIALTRADAMYQMPKWFWGSFAEIEKRIAGMLGIPVFHRNGRYFSCRKGEEK
jgi:hypothetical protein